MRLTYDLLCKHGACREQRDEFRRLFPRGCEPSIDNLLWLSSCEWQDGCYLDPWWLYNVLPDEGPGSKRAYVLWCAEQVAHLCDDQCVRDCLAVVRRKVNDPASVSGEELAAASAAASAAALDAASDAASDAAWAASDAAWAAALAAASDAAWAARAAAWAARAAASAEFLDLALVCLSALLLEA